MAELSMSESILFWYGMLVLLKTLLCYAHIDIVMGVLDRYHGKRHHALRIFSVLVVVPCLIAVTLPKKLGSERLSFFVVYSRFKVIRDMISAM